jgi:large subunit ribosomal protein L32
MALPKRKFSKQRTRKRRAAQAISAPNLVECSSCHELIIPHHMCPKCGKYGDRVVKVVEEK